MKNKIRITLIMLSLAIMSINMAILHGQITITPKHRIKDSDLREKMRRSSSFTDLRYLDMKPKRRKLVEMNNQYNCWKYCILEGYDFCPHSSMTKGFCLKFDGFESFDTDLFINNKYLRNHCSDSFSKLSGPIASKDLINRMKMFSCPHEPNCGPKVWIPKNEKEQVFQIMPG